MAIGLAVAALAGHVARAGDLEVTVTGIHSSIGAVMIGLYDSEEKFDAAIGNASSAGLLSDRGRVIGLAMRARVGSEGVRFLQLPPGRYAVIAYHDENDNGLLDTNFFGVPTEGYAFGNNAVGFLGPPAFHAASVTVESANQAMTIFLNY